MPGIFLRNLVVGAVICSFLLSACSPVKQALHDDAAFNAAHPDEADVELTDGSVRTVTSPHATPDSVVWRGHGVEKSRIAKVTYRKPTAGNAFSGAIGGMAAGAVIDSTL